MGESETRSAKHRRRDAGGILYAAVVTTVLRGCLWRRSWIGLRPSDVLIYTALYWHLAIRTISRITSTKSYCGCCVWGLWKLHQGIESMEQSEAARCSAPDPNDGRRTNSRRCGSRLKYVNAKHRRDFGWHATTCISQFSSMFLHKHESIVWLLSI